MDLDIGFMLSVLRTPFEKISDKEIATVAERMTTIRRELGRPVGVGGSEAYGLRLADVPLQLKKKAPGWRRSR